MFFLNKKPKRALPKKQSFYASERTQSSFYKHEAYKHTYAPMFQKINIIVYFFWSFPFLLKSSVKNTITQTNKMWRNIKKEK